MFAAVCIICINGFCVKEYLVEYVKALYIAGTYTEYYEIFVLGTDVDYLNVLSFDLVFPLVLTLWLVVILG